MRLLTATPSLSIFISSTYAFNVTFNDKDHCAGNNVGTFVGSVRSPSGCQTQYKKIDGGDTVTAPGGNFNVIIEAERGDDDAGVAFYGLSDCETLVAFGNVKSCLGAGFYTSFRVINITEADDQLTNLNPAPVQALSTNATATVKAGESLPAESKQASTEIVSVTSTSTKTSTITASPTTMAKKIRRVDAGSQNEQIEISKRSARPGYILHGDTYASNGQLYKYHQISARAWRGIPIAEWNEGIHKRNTAEIPSPKIPRDMDVSPYLPSSPLTPKRAILPDKCNLIRSCMIAAPEDRTLTISSAGSALLASIQSHSPDGKDWQFLQQPFVVEVLNEQGKSQGFIYAQTIYHSDVVPCTDAGSERDAVVSALVEGVNGTTISDLRVDLKIGLSGVPGATNTLFVSTRSARNKDLRIRPICEAIVIND